MENLLNLPQATIVNKTVPKNAFYKHASEGHRAYFQRLLTDEFDTITWLYKLTAATLNVADGEQVHEIDVFVCQMKRNGYSLNPFCGLDDILPRHTLFVILYGERCDIVMHHKQRRTDGKWIRGVTEMQQDVQLSQVHLKLEGLNMDNIYDGLLGQISGLQTRDAEAYEQAAADRKALETLQKKVASLEKAIRKEKYIAKKMELRNQQREAQAQIDNLINKINKYERD